jgi:hypothetical protein
MRSEIDGTKIMNTILLNGNRLGANSQTLGAGLALAADAPHLQFLDPGGSARNVDLPASPQRGDFFIIVNMADAAEVITVRTSAGAGLTPALTPTQSETAVVFYDGTNWRGFVAIGV